MGLQFGFLAFPELEELDLIGPWEIFRVWAREPGAPERYLMIAERDAPVVCSKGLRLLPDVTIDACPALDFLLVPGGMGTRKEVDNPVLIDFIARQARSCKAVLSVCTGAFLLQKAGLLAGRRATTHWRSLDRLRQCGDVTVVEQRYVQDGPIWTAAGISAGIDMALAFVASVAGPEVAARVQLNTEYYPDRTLYCENALSGDAPAYVRKR